MVIVQWLLLCGYNHGYCSVWLLFSVVITILLFSVVTVMCEPQPWLLFSVVIVQRGYNHGYCSGVATLRKPPTMYYVQRGYYCYAL
jgi:hypothetical protein